MRNRVCVLGLLILAACSDSSPRVLTDGALTVSNVSISSNPFNVLSFRVAFDAVNGDSARVLYMATTDTTGALVDSGSTPWQHVAQGPNRITPLGLLPHTTYHLTLQVTGKGGAMLEPKYNEATDFLPSDLLTAKIAWTGTPGPGYTLISPINVVIPRAYAMAFDGQGRVRWYRRFDNVSSLDAQMQRSGHITVGLSHITPDSLNIGPFVEILPSGDSLATYNAPAGYLTDTHEIVVSGDPANQIVQFFAFDTLRNVDLSGVGGAANAPIFGHSLFRQTAQGARLFAFDAWNHFDVSDALEPVTAGSDFDHPNALSFDTDSNYLVSFRDFDAVDKIDRNTGNVIWQLGGVKSSFTFKNDPFGSFSGQHFARRIANGHILLYDDGTRHSPQTSRAVEYALDTVAHTATMVWQYLPQPAVFTAIVGSVVRLANGNTVVGFAFASQIDEVGPNGNLLARGKFSFSGAKEFYRALRLPSLYRYETP